MAVINDPNTAANVARVGAVSTTTDQNAQHISGRPVAYGNLGHYKWGGFTGILPAALGANSEIFQFRWSHATLLAVILKIRISAAVSTTFFAAGVPLQLDLIKSSAWSAAGTLGTGITMGATGKARNSMASSSLVAGDMRISTTAALGAGTKTLEANSLSSMLAAGPITASLNGLIIPPNTLFQEPDLGDGEHPLVLGGAGGGANSEGFSIRSVAVPITGTWTVAISVQWAEVSAF
jgi:hypothetical protein